METIKPPYNIDAERALLGSIILNESVMVYVSKIVTSSSFYDDKHKYIFRAISNLYENKKPIDLLTISDVLTSKKQLEFIGGITYLTDLVQNTPSSSNAEHYAKIIKEKFLRRQSITLGEKIIASCLDDSQNIYELVDRMGKSLNVVNDMLMSNDKTEEERRREKMEQEALNYEGDDKVVSFASVAEDLKNKDKSPKFMTGWSSLDGLLSGFKPKHLIVLSGIMKHGKTTFAMNMISQMSHLNPLLLALEEPIEELIEKFIERGDEVPKGYSPKHSSKVKTDWIEKKVAEGVKKFGSQIVFIDNLKWIRPIEDNRGSNDAQKIADTVQEIKSIAKKWGVCIVLLVHVTKQSKADMTPTFEDFSGSADIGQLCDKAIIIWRETKRGKKGELDITNNTNVSVQLNRQGGVGLIKMRYVNGRYEEYDWGKTDEDLDEFDSVKVKDSKLLNKLNF